MEDNKCWECGKKMERRNVAYSLYGIKIGMFPALVCPRCNEPFFEEDTSRKITNLAKERGLWGLQSKTKVGQAGKTLDIRLPKRLIEFTKLRKGREVTITPENQNRIVISI